MGEIPFNDCLKAETARAAGIDSAESIPAARGGPFRDRNKELTDLVPGYQIADIGNTAHSFHFFLRLARSVLNARQSETEFVGVGCSA